MSTHPATPIERHFLYGEPARIVEPRFLHIEPIRLRSGQHNWIIAPHTHRDLHQILLVTAGGGSMRVDTKFVDIVSPALLFVPAGIIHSFDFAPTTDGHVVTVADAMLSDVARGDAVVTALREEGGCSKGLGSRVLAMLRQAFAAMSQEFVWSAPGRMLAIEAELMRILVTAGRVFASSDDDRTGASPDAALIERFRQLIEERFRTSTSVSDYARRLDVTEDRLLAACQRRFGEPSKKLIHRRIIVEAQRWLIYTAMPIGEISEGLGFRDLAYFSRFFTSRAGSPPSVFRREHRAALEASRAHLPVIRLPAG